MKNTWVLQTRAFTEDIWAATWQNQQSDCAPSEDSDKPGHPPSLIRAFAVHRKKPWVLSYPFSAQRRLWSVWADAQADLSLRWAQTHFFGFIMSRLIYSLTAVDTLKRLDCSFVCVNFMNIAQKRYHSINFGPTWNLKEKQMFEED